ncbi:MAG: DUF1735 domain-containing protein, partial [Prevotella sp.]|nr:DUF1735 domain-containing protein [Prevotella sp.]
MKNLKIKKYIYLLFSLAGVGLLGGCDDNINDFKKQTDSDAANEVYIDAANSTFTYDLYFTPENEVRGTFPFVQFPIHTKEKAKGNIRATCSVDNALVDVYNEKNGTSYGFIAPENLDVSSVTIPEGATISTDSVVLSYTKPLIELKKLPNYTNGFLIPVKIATSAGLDAKIDYAERIVYTIINIKQGNGVFIKENENSAKYTNIPGLNIFSDIKDVPFQLYSESAV